MNVDFDPYYSLLGIAPAEQPADHYRLLGIERLELNTDVIVNAAERQLDHLKRFSATHSQHALSLCEEINKARDCLLDVESHRLYAAELQGFDSNPTDFAAQAAWRSFAAEFDRAWNDAQGLEFDPQHHWLGIPRHQRPASNFRLLGLCSGERNPDVIRHAAERQVSFVRKFANSEQSEAANDLLSQLSRARAALVRSAEQLNQVSENPEVAEVVEEVAAIPVIAVDEIPTNEAEWLNDAWEVPAPEIPIPPPAQGEVKTAAVVGDAMNPALVKSLAIAGVAIVLVLISIFIASLVHKSTQDSRVADANARLRTLIELGTLDQANQVGTELENTQPSVGDSPELIQERRQLPVDTARARNKSAQFAARLRFMNNASPRIINADYLASTEALATTESEQAAIQEVRERYDTWQETERTTQTENALQKLDSYELELDEIQAGIETEATSRDRMLISSVVRNIDRMKYTFPKRSADVDQRGEELKSRASAMMEARPGKEVSPSTVPQMTPSVVTNEKSGPDQAVQQIQRNDEPSLSSTPFTAPRSWQRKSGSSFLATVSKMAEDRVRFQIPGQDQVIDIKLEDLVPADEAAVRVAFFGDQETEQLEKTRSLVSRVALSPTAPVTTLRDSHNKLRDCPYAGLWASVCLSLGENRHAEAANMLRQVISRIKRQRDVDSTRHRMTLTSALNNLAVCMIKDQKADAAASYFADSLASMPSPTGTVIHNARQLSEFTDDAEGSFRLSSISRRKLTQALTQYAGAKSRLPTGWYYSLNVDLPRYDLAGDPKAQRYLSQTASGTLQVRDTWCVACKGLGKLNCRFANCVKGVVSVSKRLQVGMNQVTGEPVYGNKNFKERCPNCSGRGGFDCPHCKDGRLP
jgi:hypothetical protein